MRAPTPEVLSPELALVSPELAAAARRSLPDRPWEQFAPPRPAARLRLVTPPAAPVVERPAPARARAARRPGTGTAIGLLAAVALVVTGLLPARDAPDLRPAGPAEPATQVPPRANPAVPGAYSTSEGSSLFVSDDARTVAGFDPPTRCLPEGATLSAPLAADGSFGVVFPHGTASVELTGRVSGGRVTGTYRVRAPGCDSGRVQFTGEVVLGRSGGPPVMPPTGAPPPG